MKPWPTVRLGEIVTQASRAEAPMPGTTYRQIGVKLWGEGAYERETMDGSQTKYAQLFRAEAGDIIVNKIWARNGSVAVSCRNLSRVVLVRVSFRCSRRNWIGSNRVGCTG